MGEELGHVESEVSIGHLCDLSASLLGLSIQSSVEACIHQYRDHRSRGRPGEKDFILAHNAIKELSVYIGDIPRRQFE